MISKPPNILLITSDQHRGDTLGCAGHPCVRTPHLDQIAYSGARFTRATSTCPVCIPTRTTWITGIPAHIYGSPAYNDTFRIDRRQEDFLGSLITAAGYRTAVIGKSHWHTDEEFDAGFETFILRRQQADAARLQQFRQRRQGVLVVFHDQHLLRNFLCLSAQIFSPIKIRGYPKSVSSSITSERIGENFSGF